MRIFLTSLVVGLVGCFSPLLNAQNVTPLPVWQVGSAAPDVLAWDERGESQRLSDFQGKYVLFDVSTPWCYPSFLLAETAAQVKAALKNQGIDLVLYTVIQQDPLQRSFPLRSQALNWKDAFPATDVVVAWHRGLDEEILNQIPAARSLVGPNSSAAFPTFAIIDPAGIVRQIVQGTPSPDGLLAYFLPNQPPLPPVTVPTIGVTDDRARLSVTLGRASGVQNAPFFTIPESGMYSVPWISHGSAPLPAGYGLGINKEMSPGQEIWTIYYDTGAAKGPDDHGIPADLPITFVISNVHWLGLPGVVPTGKAELYLWDNVLPASRGQVPVSYLNNGDIQVGPFKAGSGFYPFRFIQVQLYFAQANPRELAVFGVGETQSQGTLSNDQMLTLVEEWHGIEYALALPAHTPELNLALDRIDALSKDITRISNTELPTSEKGLLKNMLIQMKAAVVRQSKQ